MLVAGIVAVMYMRLLHKRARTAPPPQTGTAYPELAAEAKPGMGYNPQPVMSYPAQSQQQAGNTHVHELQPGSINTQPVVHEMR